MKNKTLFLPQLQLRADFAEVWKHNNPILTEGEIGIEKDSRRFKIGTGVTPWNELAYSDTTNMVVSDIAPNETNWEYDIGTAWVDVDDRQIFYLIEVSTVLEMDDNGYEEIYVKKATWLQLANEVDLIALSTSTTERFEEVNQTIADTERQLTDEINTVKTQLTERIDEVNADLDDRKLDKDFTLYNPTTSIISTDLITVVRDGVVYSYNLYDFKPVVDNKSIQVSDNVVSLQDFPLAEDDTVIVKKDGQLMYLTYDTVSSLIDYNLIYNKPTINGIEIKGALTASEIGIDSAHIGHVYVNNKYTGTVEDGSSSFPYKTIQSGITNAPFGSIIHVSLGEYVENLVFDNKQNITIITDGVAGQFRTVVDGSVTINSNSYRIGIGNFEFLGKITIASGTVGEVMVDSVSCAGFELTETAVGYVWVGNKCQIMGSITVAGSGTLEIENSQFEEAGTCKVLSGALILTAVDYVTLVHTGGVVVARGGTYFTKNTEQNNAIVSSADDGGLFLLDCSTFGLDGTFSGINKSGKCPYMLAMCVHEPTIDNILYPEYRLDGGLHTTDIYTHYDAENYTPLGNTTEKHLQGIDNELGKKLDIVTGATTYMQAYTKNGAGAGVMINMVPGSAVGGSITLRTPEGAIFTNEPTEDKHAVNKIYLASETNTTKTELKAYTDAEQQRATNAEQSLSTRTETIESKIPTQASSANQLADKDFVNSTAQNFAANFVTPTALGDNTQWSNFAILQAGPWYHDGTSYLPTKNDYAIYIDTDNSVWRAHYTGTVWQSQYKVNDTTFTAAQQASINSGVTQNIIDVVIPGKADKTNVTAQTSGYAFPFWNADGVITGKNAKAVSERIGNINGVALPFYASGTTNFTIFAPTLAGSDGQVLVSSGSGAPEWVDFSSVSGFAPIAHAVGNTTYGMGTDVNYGHLRLSANTNLNSGVGGGFAATPSAVQTVNTLVSNLTSNFNTHTANKSNPHEVTKAQVGLGDVVNLAPANLPLSNAAIVAFTDVTRYKGTYSATTTYAKNDMVVSSTGLYFISLINNNLGNSPKDNMLSNSIWQNLNYNSQAVYTLNNGNPVNIYLAGTTNSATAYQNLQKRDDVYISTTGYLYDKGGQVASASALDKYKDVTSYKGEWQNGVMYYKGDIVQLTDEELVPGYKRYRYYLVGALNSGYTSPLTGGVGVWLGLGKYSDYAYRTYHKDFSSDTATRYLLLGKYMTPDSTDGYSDIGKNSKVYIDSQSNLYDSRGQVASVSNTVTLNTAQTITEIKTFKGTAKGIRLENDSGVNVGLIRTADNGTDAFVLSMTGNMVAGNSSNRILFTSAEVRPETTNKADLGSTSTRWKNLYLSGSLKSNIGTSTYVSAAQGNAMLSSDRTAGAYSPLTRALSTNGAFVNDVHQNLWGVRYLTKANIDSNTNTVTHSLLFAENGVLTASGGFKGNVDGNAVSATKATQDGDGNIITNTYMKKTGAVSAVLNESTKTLTLTIN